MTFLVVSFIAGMLTVLAPCILPLLPVVIGSSVTGRSKWTPYIVVGSLALSVILFTYLLKVSTLFINIPPEVWTYLSGGVLVLFGLTLVVPSLWENIPGLAKLSANANKAVGAGYQKKNVWGDVLIGAALGPVFSTCSPTYFVILASVLPASFLLGSLYLLAYVAGLSLILLLLAILGEKLAGKLNVLADPKGLFKKVLGVLFIILGLLIFFGIEKKIQSALVNNGFFDVTKIEQKILENAESSKTDTSTTTAEVAPASGVKESNSLFTGIFGPKPTEKSAYKEFPYAEIVNPAGFVNTGGKPITIGEQIGKKVVLLEILTYSCINCQRGFPFIRNWYSKYSDEGLEIIGIHTPEFAFEKNIENVKKAAKEFGLDYPLVLDNDYATWNAYKNQYWPRKYLIDINGNVVYDHIGEGDYEETEQKIIELLKERAVKLGISEGADTKKGGGDMPPEITVSHGSPETYFGSFRNSYFANGKQGVSGEQSLTIPATIQLNKLYLTGTWDVQGEYAKTVGAGSIIYKYNAKEVYLVLHSETAVDVEVWQDGKKVEREAGESVSNGIMTVQESRLYKIIRNETAGEHTLELRVPSKGLEAYAFTFG